MSTPTGPSDRPEDQKRNEIRQYYKNLDQMTVLILEQFTSLYRWIDREHAELKDLIDELKYFIRQAKQDWLNSYQLRKEPLNPDDPGDSIYSMCKVCLTSYEAAIIATNIEAFKIEFQRIDDVVGRIHGRAKAMLEQNNFPLTR